MSQNENNFTFAISLSVLNHLGRNLYRSFVTVLGEAISNSWDADAENVWVFIDREKGTLMIKDDGMGMDAEDFQNKFLKIGYSKRLAENKTSKRDRPFIGRKGIGKLALLSCSEKVTIISRKSADEDYVGGGVNNSELDDAIDNDLNPSNYPLEDYDLSPFEKYLEDHDHGTMIYFEGIKEGIRNKEDYLRKIIALYFRFALIDDSFKIHFNDALVGLIDLADFSDKTEFLWNINNFEDPYLKYNLKNVKEVTNVPIENSEIRGFIASTDTPKALKITNTDEKISIDLFVNGRLRKKDLMEYISTERLASQYLYGQIHMDTLDEGEDVFTSSREGVVSDNPKFIEMINKIGPKIREIINEWDKLRLKHKKEGDSENPSISRKERSSRSLFNAVSEDYTPPEKPPRKDGDSGENPNDENRKKVEEWVNELEDDAQYNFTSYAECFISENLLRKHIEEKSMPLSSEAQTKVTGYKDKETQNKHAGNVNIDIRKILKDVSYLSMDELANLIDKCRDPNHNPGLSRDAKEYKPIRDALMHTALLTDEAKEKLTTVKSNIKGRVRTLLEEPEEDSS